MAIHWGQLKTPKTVLQHVRGDRVVALDWELVGGPYVEIKTIEIALNYKDIMYRYQILQPTFQKAEQADREQVVRNLFGLWAELLMIEKRRQMNIEDRAAWPPLSFLPWDIHEVWDMPVVVWLRRQW